MEDRDTSFNTRDFSNVDDIISIIDSKKESSESTEQKAVDKQDNGTEFGVGREENAFPPIEDQPKETKSESSQEASSEGTPEEQSVSSEDVNVDKSEAEETQEAQESQSNEDTKESVETANEEVIKDDEALFVELDGEDVEIDQIIDEWKNNQNWQKTNTEKAQQLAEQKKAFEESTKNLRTDDIKDALENDEFMEALDDWFEGSDKNPFRNAVKELENTKPEPTQEAEAVDPDRVALDIDKEIFELQKIDESLNDENNLNTLAKFALDNDVSLPIAHKLMYFDDAVNEIDSLRSELKARNEELSKLKKQAQDSIPAELPKGKGAVSEGFKGTSGSWRGAEDRILQKLGLKT